MATRTARDTAERYELKEELGVGATATVWRARDRRSGRQVCVKRLHPHLAADDTARERLEAEVASARRVSHPAVVPVLDTQLSELDPLLVFPYIEGETLSARLARSGALEPTEAARIGAEIAAALAAVHAAGVVHRDIKPSNILLGVDGRVRLLDFGISRALDESSADLTGAGLAIGTLPYMAPEQLAGNPPSPVSDVFALGAVLYEMLDGRPPFEGKTALAMAQAQRLPPADIAGVPQSLSALALAALSHEADARPSAAELADSLGSWRESGSADAPTVVVAVPAVTVSRRPSFGAPSRKSVAVGTLVATLALAVVSAFALAPDRSQFDGDDAVIAAPENSALPTPATNVEAKTLDPVANTANEPSEPTRAAPAGESKPKAKGNDNDQDKKKGKGKGEGKGKGKDNGR